MVDISKIDMERINGLIDKFNEITLNFTNLLNNIDSKINSMKYVVDASTDGNRWYRKWNDGFIEQGGNIIINLNNAGEGTINFLTPFNTTSYIPVITVYNSSGSWIYGWIKWDSRTKNNFTYFSSGSKAGDTSNGSFWYASGY